MNRPAALAFSGNASSLLQPAILIAFALALGAGTVPAASASVEGFHYTREVQVPAPGWVRVPLDLAAIQHLAPGASDLRVFSPAGAEIPLRIEPAAPRVERRPVTLSRPERVDDGWNLAVDLGADPPPHERLFLQPLRPPLAPPDRIESSLDGSAWQPLAAGEPPAPEASEGAGDSEWVAISYSASGDRYLRFHWPRQAQPPRIAAAEVEAVTGPALSVTTGNPECDTSQPGTAFCTLALPAAGQIVRRLTVEVQGGGRIGYRLAAPRDSRWQDLAEGVWQRGEGPARHLIAGGPAPVADSLLRLELHGSPQSPPRIANWGVELTVQTILFRAEEPGRYVLAYGGPATGTRRAEPPDGVETAWLEAGAEAEHSPAPLPAAVTAPAVRLGSRRLAASWRVVAPSAKPGFLVRLELPDAVYRAARADLGNLRLVSGERQIPFYRWSPAAPALVARLWDLDPAGTGRRSRESEVEIRLPEAGLALTELDLTASARPLRRAVGVRYQEPAGAPRRENGKRRDRPAAVRQVWKCQPQPPLPCLGRLALPGHAPQVLAVRFQDGDNPPLTDLDVALWRRRDVLLFVWPEAEETAPVRLLVGPENLRTPSYDLTALGDSLLSYPWQPAELSLEGGAAPSEPRWARWVMPTTLVIAGICLIVLLGRILSET
ncbi:MAG TPA: hypothetical protein VHC97_22810 [Thermoanaerobaculia bacterium]|jgi:hypothetical protein|nr:hypothetical protein [Thermoanaerobaculia bacterium]